jgi:hypothetical protein
MKHLLSLLILITCTGFVCAQNNTGELYLKKVHERFYQGPCKIYSFSQKNGHYRNDSLIKNSVWHEVIEFPDKFRIHFGEVSDGNYVLFKNDSAYNYRKTQLIKSRADSNSLLLILGGMFYRSFEHALFRLKNAGYNTAIHSEQQWNAKEVVVIGAEQGDLSSNQIWFDKKTRKVVRIIEKLNANDSMDMRFESYQDWCKGHVETKVAFYRNGKLEQVEEYYDLKILDKFPE